jgi:hypothetical protein
MTAPLTAAIEQDVSYAQHFGDCDSSGFEELRYSAEDLSAFFYELECLLVHIEKADTHYKVLGIDYLSTTGEITTAYLKAMILLDPASYGLAPELAIDLGSRVSLATERVSEAFRILMDFDERLEYDARLFGWEKEDSKRTSPQQRSKLGTSSPASKPPRTNRRARERFQLPMPVEVTGYDESASDWHEVVESIDLSRGGACILLQRRLSVGNILYLRMPMPVVLRSHEFLEQTYGTYAIVRWVHAPRDGFGRTGIEFIGELPPPGFRERPWAVFNIGKSDVDRRSEPREQISEAIEIEYFDESEQFINKDTGFIEDISSSGVRVCAPQPPSETHLIRVIRPKVSMTLFAQVRNRFRGRDGYHRLCAQLINGSACYDEHRV